MLFRANYVVQMRDFLLKKLKDGPTHINRDEIETVGSNMGLSPDESARLFESLKDAHWWGGYTEIKDEKGWIAVLVTDVR